MPNRILRDWTDSEVVNSLSLKSEVVFTRLIMKVDDFGRYGANPKLLASVLFPLRDDVDAKMITDCLTELHQKKLVSVYCVDDKMFLEIANFDKNPRARASKFPSPLQASASKCKQVQANAPVFVSVSVSESVSVISSSDDDGGVVEVAKKKPKAKSFDFSPDFNLFWLAYPKKVGKGDAWNAWKKQDLPPIDSILRSVHKAKKSPEWNKERGNFIPHPSTWLNQGRFLDEGMDYGALTQKRVVGLSSQPQEAFLVDDHDALSWIAENYELKAGVPYREWPGNVQAEYRNHLKKLQAV